MKPNYKCADCRVDTSKINEYYMLRNDVWQETKVGRGMLCIGCVETRLGRKLNASDFGHVPLNVMGGQSDRLLNRLGNFADLYGERIWDDLRKATTTYHQ